MFDRPAPEQMQKSDRGPASIEDAGFYLVFEEAIERKPQISGQYNEKNNNYPARLAPGGFVL